MTDLSTLQGQARHYAAVHRRLMNGPPRLRPLPAPPPLPPLAPPAPPPELVLAALLPEPEVCEAAEVEAPPTDAPAPVLLLTEPAWRTILAEVADKHDLTVLTIISDQRAPNIVRARQEVMYRLSRETTMSLPAIGRRLRRDHTTVLHGIRQHAQRLATAGSLPTKAPLPDLSEMPAWEAICLGEAWKRDLTLKDIVGPDRSIAARRARREAIARMTDELQMPPERIGELLGRSKTTINQTLGMYRAQARFELAQESIGAGR